MKKLKLNFEKNSIFTSKSDVLKLLKNQIKLSRIEKILDFTVEDWQKNKNKILAQLVTTFSNKKVIIRSSAIGEDSEKNSEAGRYESVLNINSNSRSQLTSAINHVINSYKENNNLNKYNQILVQTQTLDIITSGVIFTRTPDLGSPYYVINYEEGESTVGVTQGSVSETIKISKYSNAKTLTKKWNVLLSAIKEIESIIYSDSLDIEFGITQNNIVVIFQVRPMISFKKFKSGKFDSHIKTKINQNQKKFSKLQNSNELHGSSLIFSDMTDWNPAEIIGNKPKLLDYSLYNFLVMKDAWYKGRIQLGYQKFNPHSLMVKFGNKPYVDIRTSFNSFIPASFEPKLKKKLMNYYLEKLSKNPQLHDKAEFEILFTSYDLSLKKRLKELQNFNFSKNEIERIYDLLLSFTQKIIDEFPKTSMECDKSIKKMTKNRLSYMKKLRKVENYSTKLKTAENLLSDCRNFGTIPFSLMARIAFIGTAFLKSSVSQGYVSKKSIDRFMNSLDTPLSNFQGDLIKFYDNKITKKQFLEKYGHLRPGTYDITVDRYDKENPFLNDIKFRNIKASRNSEHDFKKIVGILKSENFMISFNDLFSFIRNSLTMRENLKFEFTKNLSDALELIADAASDLGFSREDVAHLDINTIFSSYSIHTQPKLKSFWKKKIERNKHLSEVNDRLVLPSIIFSENDFELIQYYFAKPNYITEKSITAKIINLDISKTSYEIENKIILLEHADPGYDWLFARNPAGLITKYGGVASHMSIRCSEVGLPAAIGCGEIIFDAIYHASKVLLDCKNQQIIILEHEKHDEFFEQKKVLKSLGYIK